MQKLLRVGENRPAQEAGAHLFEGLRLRLTLWYCGVLGAALVLFSLALYFGTSYFLLHPIQMDAQAHAQGHINQWLSGQLDHACPLSSPQGRLGPPPDGGYFMPQMVLCFDQKGSLLPGENTSGLPSALLSNALAQSALQTGQPVTSTVDVGGTVGHIYQYAQVVPGPAGSGYSGVVVVLESVQGQTSALSLLLMLLLSVGSIALIGAGAGGFFLANRALEPARLAWSNQQRFIADASHELRTPLTLLRADAEVLLRGRHHFDAEDVVLLENIVVETSHMSRIATNLLTLARLDSGSTHREHEVVNLVELAREGVQRMQALADQQGITLRLEQEGEPYVIGDQAMLEQALLVLLDNAIKYNQQGGSVTLHTGVKDGQALLEVRDTGIGIPTGHLAHLGERFYRVDKARSRKAGGTGLGLSIARGIAVAHDGQLLVTSVPHQGTTATLALPLAQGSETAVKMAHSPGESLR